MHNYQQSNYEPNMEPYLEHDNDPNNNPIIFDNMDNNNNNSVFKFHNKFIKPYYQTFCIIVVICLIAFLLINIIVGGYMWNDDEFIDYQTTNIVIASSGLFITGLYLLIDCLGNYFNNNILMRIIIPFTYIYLITALIIDVVMCVIYPNAFKFLIITSKIRMVLILLFFITVFIHNYDIYKTKYKNVKNDQLNEGLINAHF